MPTAFRRSPLALAILGLLEDGPLHPYGMQQLIKQWGKDQVINVGQRASLYKMITRLAEADLITIRETTREHQYPERTTYELTDAGAMPVGSGWPRSCPHLGTSSPSSPQRCHSCR